MRAQRLASAIAVATLAAASSVTALAQDLVQALQSAKVVELNFVWDQKSPVLPFNPPFAAALVNTHKQTNGWIPQLSFAADMMYFSGQHGAPTMDALGHIGHDGKLFGGLAADQNWLRSIEYCPSHWPEVPPLDAAGVRCTGDFTHMKLLLPVLVQGHATRPLVP